MDKSQGFALPGVPPKGKRRTLEAQWLAAMSAQKVPQHMFQAPVDAPPQLGVAVQQFNAGMYWDCHETLEEVWLPTAYPLRFFYSALIKTAVGFYHIGKRNPHGARIKLGDAVRLLPYFQPCFLGVDTQALLRDTSVWLRMVDGEEQVDWARLSAMRPPIISASLRQPD